jgi:2-polyprenyl-6-methoxyphenol hydroxylase-like FAD-dependent oxidoreductase
MADRSQRQALSGSRAKEEILGVCRRELDRGWFSDATFAGPGATFPNACRWVPHPNSEGLVLIGDAAGTGDPSIGQGLAVTMRDIGELSRRLIDSADWTQAGTDFARTRLRYFQTQRMIARCTWQFDAPGPEGEKLRGREGRSANRGARRELMRRIRLDPAQVVPSRKARKLILYG